jgi:hypothetical protein
MIPHTCNSGARKTEAGGLRVQASLGYIGRPCLKKQNDSKQTNKLDQMVSLASS